MGVFLAKVLPNYKFRFLGSLWHLNEGHFSVKEHVLTYVIASGGAGIAYGLDNVVTQRLDMFMVLFIYSLPGKHDH